MSVVKCGSGLPKDHYAYHSTDVRTHVRDDMQAGWSAVRLTVRQPQCQACLLGLLAHGPLPLPGVSRSIHQSLNFVSNSRSTKPVPPETFHTTRIKHLWTVIVRRLSVVLPLSGIYKLIFSDREQPWKAWWPPKEGSLGNPWSAWKYDNTNPSAKPWGTWLEGANDKTTRMACSNGQGGG